MATKKKHKNINTQAAAYMLDTNILWQGDLVRQARTAGASMAISRVVYAEFPSQLRRRREQRAAHQYIEGFRAECGIEVVEIGDRGAIAYAETAAGIPEVEWKSAAERKRRLDRLIAAAASSSSCVLVTANLSDFDQCRVEVISDGEFASRVGYSPPQRE